MFKKVILTESQYTRLTEYINEKKVVKGKNSSKNNSNNLGDFTNWVNTEIIPIFIRKVKPNTGINIKFGNKIINLCCISRNGNTFTFTLNTDTNIKEFKNWKIFTIKFRGTGKKGENLYKLNKELIQTTNGQTLDLKLVGSYGKTTKIVWIKDIYDIELANCGKRPPKKVKQKPVVKPKVEPTEPEKIKPEVEKSNEELIDDAEVAMHLILNDPNLKKAFYTQPSLWNLFTAELKGKEATGSGIVPTLDIVGRYMSKRLGETLGADFMEGETVKYQLVDKEVIFNYKDDNNMDREIKLVPNKPYYIKVGRRDFDDNFYVLFNQEEKFKILIKEKTQTPNVYLCDIVKVNFNKESKDDIRENINIKFLTDDNNANGYKPKTK